MLGYLVETRHGNSIEKGEVSWPIFCEAGRRMSGRIIIPVSKHIPDARKRRHHTRHTHTPGMMAWPCQTGEGGGPFAMGNSESTSDDWVAGVVAMD